MKIIIIIAILFFLFSCSGEENNKKVKIEEKIKVKQNNTGNIVENKEIKKVENSFYIEKPKDWFENKKISIIQNIKRFDFSKEKMNEILKNNNGTVSLILYTKYDLEKISELSPTIQVNLRKNPNNNFKSFKNDIVKSANQFENMFANFKFIDKPKEIEIKKIKSIYFKSSFDIFKDGKKHNVVSWSYAIPKGKYFYQINFSDVNGEDNSEIYKNIIKTIKLPNSKIIRKKILKNKKTNILIGKKLELNLKSCEFNSLGDFYSCKSDLNTRVSFGFLGNTLDIIKNRKEEKNENSNLFLNEAKDFLKKYEKVSGKQKPNYDENKYFDMLTEKSILINKRDNSLIGLTRYLFMDKNKMRNVLNNVYALYGKNSEKLLNDYAVFLNIKFEKIGKFYKISGDRYSNSKKITKPFYILIEKINGKIKIIEEYQES